MNSSYIAEGTRVIGDIAGSVVRAAISSGEPVTDDRLIKKGDRGFLSAIMAPGTRAVTVQLQQNAGLGGLVLPGDHVDVVLTAVIPGSGSGDPEHRASETVLEDIRVLAIDQKMSDMSNETIMARSATLEVTPKQAEILALVSDMGKLSLTLRAIAAGDDKPMTTDEHGEPKKPSVIWDNEATDLGLKPHSAPAAADADAKVDLVRGDVDQVVSISRRTVSDMNRRSLTVRFVAMLLGHRVCGVCRCPACAPPKWSRPRRADPVDVSKGLIIRLDRPCSSVFVADPDIADVQLKSPTVLYIMGKGAGETTIYAVDQQDAVLLNSRVEVRQDVDRLQREIQQIDPGSKVTAKAVDDSIVLEGNVKDAAEGDDIRKIAARYVASPAQLVNKLSLDAPNQIDLQVRVAEVQRSVLKQFGINWDNSRKAGRRRSAWSAQCHRSRRFNSASGNAITKIVPGRRRHRR